MNNQEYELQPFVYLMKNTPPDVDWRCSHYWHAKIFNFICLSQLLTIYGYLELICVGKNGEEKIVGTIADGYEFFKKYGCFKP